MDVETDVLIVGSGLIGAVFARKIINADVNNKVLMIDIGEQGSRLIGDHKKNSVAVQKDIGRFTSTIQGGWSRLSIPVSTTTTTYLDLNSWPPYHRNHSHENWEQSPHDNLPAAVAVREVGGMGCYWTCSTPEQHPEIERSSIFDHKEWEDLYREARTLFHTTTTAFDDSVRQDIIKDVLSRAQNGREFQSMPLACQRSKNNPDFVEWTSTATILGDLADPRYSGDNFQLLAQHCCSRLRIDSASGQVAGAEVKNLLTNQTILVRAKKYVICAGAVLTTGILHNSGITARTGWPALGRYMTEQTVSWCQVMLKRSHVESKWNDPRCREHFRKFGQDPLRIPYNDPDPQIHRDAYGYGAVAPDIDQRLVVDLRFFGYVKPVYENYVEFSSTLTDNIGMPQPTFHYQLDREDAERAHAMMKDMVNLASDLGSFLPGSEPRFLTPGAALHICGTTRTGREDDGESVVDRYSQVWRIRDLFIGGCGVIPTANACNPTLTAAYFAIVAARKVAEELKQPKAEEAR